MGDMGNNGDMQPDVDSARVRSRAQLLPEEKAAGSDAPIEQATEVLRDSEHRTDEAVRLLSDAQQRTVSVEHRTSEEATDPTA
jgi:hypothetical protein